jgi:hypothetical protein
MKTPTALKARDGGGHRGPRAPAATPSPRAAGSLLEDDQGKLLGTLNHLTEKLGRPVML